MGFRQTHDLFARQPNTDQLRLTAYRFVEAFVNWTIKPIYSVNREEFIPAILYLNEFWSVYGHCFTIDENVIDLNDPRETMHRTAKELFVHDHYSFFKLLVLVCHAGQLALRLCRENYNEELLDQLITKTAAYIALVFETFIFESGVPVPDV